MAKVDFSAGIDSATGALDSNHELITRQKHLHGPDGKITKECKHESYYQMNKRDYKHNPPIGAELAHLQHFGEAAKRTTVLIHAYKFPYTATNEQRDLIEQFRRRFQAQLEGHADPQAPFEKDGKQRHYYRFDNFMRAMIYQELKND